jgi:hypothetical protein
MTDWRGQGLRLRRGIMQSIENIMEAVKSQQYIGELKAHCFEVEGICRSLDIHRRLRLAKYGPSSPEVKRATALYEGHEKAITTLHAWIAKVEQMVQENRGGEGTNSTRGTAEQGTEA